MCLECNPVNAVENKFSCHRNSFLYCCQKKIWRKHIYGTLKCLLSHLYCFKILVYDITLTRLTSRVTLNCERLSSGIVWLSVLLWLHVHGHSVPPTHRHMRYTLGSIQNCLCIVLHTAFLSHGGSSRSLLA